MMGSSGASASAQVQVAGVAAFAPTVSGRTGETSPGTNYVVYAQAVDFEIAPGTASTITDSAIHLIKTSTDCFIRVGCNASPLTTEQWYNTGGTPQGDPGVSTGTGTNVFQLNEVPDSVNIYNVAETNTLGTSTFSNVNGGTSYTSDDKSTFFSPTTDAKYGRNIASDASCTGGFCSDIDDGYIQLQFTFRKTGADDYTVTFSGRARGNASVEF